jgi:uncharacterized protein YecE (DUF72 family)
MGLILFSSCSSVLVTSLLIPMIIGSFTSGLNKQGKHTEGPWEMLKQYNIAAAIPDLPARENLQFLSDVIMTADHSFIRFHGRNTKGHYWYKYLYSKQELEPWIDKVNQIKSQIKVLRVYFNNHYGGKDVVNALQFKEMTGASLTQLEVRALEHAEKYLSNEL